MQLRRPLRLVGAGVARGAQWARHFAFFGFVFSVLYFRFCVFGFGPHPKKMESPEAPESPESPWPWGGTQISWDINI